MSLLVGAIALSDTKMNLLQELVSAKERAGILESEEDIHITAKFTVKNKCEATANKLEVGPTHIINNINVKSFFSYISL